MTEIKLYKTTIKGLKIIGMCLPFVVIGVWIITQEPYGTTPYIMGWLCTCFFGLGIPIGLFQVFDKRPQIIINEDIIWDRTTKQGEIKWEQIIEAYSLEISGQNFIALVTDDTFVFKKKLYKWAAKLNKKVGAQKLNLHLGQINIDVIEMTNLINALSKADKEERKKLIKSFKVNKVKATTLDLKKILLYVLISVSLLLVSLTGLAAFMTIMIVMGIAALIARWYSGSNKKTILRKYAELITWFGLVNMVLMLLTFQSYDYVTESVGKKISFEIDEYKAQNFTFPNDIQSVTENLDLCFLERYFVNKIEYKMIDGDYELGINSLNNKPRKFDKNNNKWK